MRRNFYFIFVFLFFSQISFASEESFSEEYEIPDWIQKDYKPLMDIVSVSEGFREYKAQVLSFYKRSYRLRSDQFDSNSYITDFYFQWERPFLDIFIGRNQQRKRESESESCFYKNPTFYFEHADQMIRWYFANTGLKEFNFKTLIKLKFIALLEAIKYANDEDIWVSDILEMTELIFPNEFSDQEWTDMERDFLKGIDWQLNPIFSKDLGKKPIKDVRKPDLRVFEVHIEEKSSHASILQRCTML